MDLYKNIEYLDIVKRGKTLLNFSANDINGHSTREIELIVGDKIGEGIYRYSMKIKGNDKKKMGSIRGVVLESNKKNINPDASEIVKILEKKFNLNNPDEISRLTKELYEVKIETYKETIQDLKTIIREQKEKIANLEKLFNDSSFEDPKDDSFLESIKPFLPALAKKLGLIEM